MNSERERLDTLCINSIRFLAADAIQSANSGHPGMPMGAAPMAYVLWDKFLTHNPKNSSWPNRDRFILSAGHASMLLYSLLYLTGYELSLDDLKQFRQWDSKTPGHPEYALTPGVEVTTGPLGQGLSHAVGMAMAEAHLAAKFNRPDATIIDHFTYVIASDGDLMEGVTAEACALAGHLSLGKLIVLYDDNRVSLAGSTSLAFSEDVDARFAAYGWQVQAVEDGENLEAIESALKQARENKKRPSLIRVRTEIACGAPNVQGSYKTHGAPLGETELVAAKEHLQWPSKEAFFVPDVSLEHYRLALTRGKEAEQAWQRQFDAYAASYPDLAGEFTRTITGDLPEQWDATVPVFEPEEKGPATRKASEAFLQAVAPRLPELMGGSADLNPSCYTWLKGFGDFQSPHYEPEDKDGAVGTEWGHDGRNIHFGVREHAMAAIANGMALHGGIIPFTGTFLTFSDYMRPSIRLAALMGLRVVYVFTHDSIGVGEDGPTHQPVEQTMSLRLIPNLTVFRPSDANETMEAWRRALMNRAGPTALILTRQNVPVFDRNAHAASSEAAKGAYILWQSAERVPDLILIGTGSETSIALDAGKKLAHEGCAVRVVAMPSWELFEAQSPVYRDTVLPALVRARVAVEAGITTGWQRYVGIDGAIVGMRQFGASAPAGILYEKFSITVERVVEEAEKVLKRIGNSVRGE